MNIVVLITSPNLQEAHKISQKPIEEKLIACANIVERIQSIFWWEGKTDRAEEVLIILKSKKSLFKKIMKTVRAAHSYKVPEILALPIIDGNPDYLKWISESVRKLGG